ncbi:unnamed protein product [Cylicocyclus nassatus]|uniref:Uncharacterized protein n=1 Tax=Cylicocyclus nassatus TaxID=53992 RepID=A0AA36MBR3_CYLNA|nr:unnamed protein product [Cylicocyclus nassatus]
MMSNNAQGHMRLLKSLFFSHFVNSLSVCVFIETRWCCKNSLHLIDAMTPLFIFTFLLIVESSTIGKKVKVPDNDPALQNLIYRSALLSSNGQIQDTVWWVPNGESYQATKVSVPNGGKLYSTYSFHMVLVKSSCDVKKVPVSSLRSCKPLPRSPQVLCQVALAWNENDWNSIEIENYCARK